MRRIRWRTRFGFYLAAIGSAFGLGNLWRFPYIVAENGGGAFVLLYCLLAFLIGLPLLIGELMLGRMTRSGVVVALDKIRGAAVGVDRVYTNQIAALPKELAVKRSLPWVWVGRMALTVCFLIISYYAVISGWVLHFIVQLGLGLFQRDGFDASLAMSMLRENGFLQVGLAGFHLAVVMVLVFKGLQNGVEKSVGYMMPVFAAFLVWLMLYSLSLPTAGEALRFLFYPDFSKLSWSSLGQALGHVFFTLSIGFGTMVTFGSYLSDESPIPVAGLRVTVFDTLISLCAGLLIFPILVMHPGSPIGPEVLFQALPQLFQDMGTAGSIFGLAFFVCLYLAALSASLGIMETLVSNLVDRWGISRRLATWLCGVGIFFVGLVPALSSTAFREFRIHERGLLEFLDGALINWFLPLTTLGMCLAVGYALKDESRKNEFFASSRVVIPRIYRDWNAIIRWMAPVLILLALVLQLLDLF